MRQVIIVCPYCSKELSEVHDSCCGEVGHGELCYIDTHYVKNVQLHINN